MNAIQLTPVTRPFRRTIQIPGSKSITNRALPLAALAQGMSTLTGVLFAEDTIQMLNALQALGYDLTVDRPHHKVHITGRGTDIPNPTAELSCGNSGTTLRFLAALLTLPSTGTYTLDGIARMRQRPIGQLVDQLTALGAKIEYPDHPGFPPIRIHAHSLAGGGCEFSDAQSSQFISAILMAAPYALRPVQVKLSGPITSEPYVLMTLRMMEQFSVRATVSNPSAETRVITVPRGQYQHREYHIEPDASNASYFLAAAALYKDASITIQGLGRDSLQGDIAFAKVLEQMGAGLRLEKDSVTITGTGNLTGLDLDMNHIPDMVQTLAVVALFAEGPTVIRNVANLRIKETDRLAALEAELNKFGAQIITTRSSIEIVPPKTLPASGPSIATYDDHRMAMAFAIAALKIPGTQIQDPGCTAKTYPEFFTDFAAAVA